MVKRSVGKSLGLQSSRDPRGAGGARPTGSVVDAKLSLHPQFHCICIESKPAPIGRPRYLHIDLYWLIRAWAAIRDAKAARFANHGIHQFFARVHRLALMACPGAQSALPGTRPKI